MCSRVNIRQEDTTNRPNLALAELKATIADEFFAGECKALTDTKVFQY
jgi:hypothetical protein